MIFWKTSLFLSDSIRPLTKKTQWHKAKNNIIIHNNNNKNMSLLWKPINVASLHLSGQTFCLHAHLHRYSQFQILGDCYIFALVLLIFINEQALPGQRGR